MIKEGRRAAWSQWRSLFILFDEFYLNNQLTMKKQLLLLSALAMGGATFAQTESAFVDAETLLGTGAAKTAVNVDAGTVVCKSNSVTMSTAYATTYKIVSMSADGDAVNQIKIDGVVYDAPKGIQGQDNPNPNSIAAPQTTGAVFRFTTKANGMLYVFSKLSYNKNYFVWESESEEFGAAAGIMPYTLCAFDAKTADEYRYTLPTGTDDYYEIGNVKCEENSWSRTYIYYAYSKDESVTPKPYQKLKITWEDYENNLDKWNRGKEGVADSINALVKANKLTLCEKEADGADGNLCSEIKNNGSTLLQAAAMVASLSGQPCAWSTTTSNGLGVIAFPVYEGAYYNVNACGSKITCDGFVFVPGAEEDPLATIAATKDESTAIKNIAIDELDTNAPIYNLQGQRVGEGYKGICIQNGKKFIVK